MAVVMTQLASNFARACRGRPYMPGKGLLLGASVAFPALAVQESLPTWLSLINAMPAVKQAALVICGFLALCAIYLYLANHNSKVLLLDFHCFKIPEHLKVSRRQLIDILRSRKCFTEDSLEFMELLMDRNGLGDATGLPAVCHELGDPAKTVSLNDMMTELEMVMFDAVENLFKKTNIDPQEVGVVITACSCFAPTPSMASMLVNRFKMRRDVLTYSLAGMGCSASLVCVDMAKHLLKALPNKLCLIFNHETVSANMYEGNTRSMMMCNTLFRLGGAAVLLSNRPCDQRRAKYELKTSLRTHMGADDEAFTCMGNGEDPEGQPGIFLRKTIIGVTGRAMKEALTVLAPHVLPYTELVKCAFNKKYKPSFGAAFEHFLFHIGGKGVLDSLQKGLNLTDKDMQPARDTLDQFGNMSAASTWYIWAHIENQGVRKGDRLWQLGIGGGFKANSAVWRARRDIHQAHDCWAGSPSGSSFNQ